MPDLAQRLAAARDRLNRSVGHRDALQRQLRDEEIMAAKHEAEADRLNKAAEVVQAAAEARRQELKDRVEVLVTRGLRAVFGRDDFEFGFEVQLRRDVFGIVPVLRSRFGERTLETVIADGRAGGLKDVISFLLRVIVLSLARPRVTPLLVLDETFRHVSLEYLRGCATLLKELNASAGMQFVLVTHKPELLDCADVIYRTELVNDRTVFHLEHDMRDEVYHAQPPRGSTPPDRSTLFDHEDLSKPDKDAQVVQHETTDLAALRGRAKGKRKRS